MNMEIKQIASLVNSVLTEISGESATLITEDLGNIADIGSSVLGNNTDSYVKALSNRIGKTLFNDRVYNVSVPNVIMDSWEYGSVLQKVSAIAPEFSNNDSWDLNNGQEYSPNVFYKPTVSQKFYNKKVTFEANLSFTDRQVKESFNSADELNSFLSMLYTTIENSFNIQLEALIQRTINNQILETINSEYGNTSLSESSKVKAVNLLYLYNQLGNELTVDKALSDKSFLQFASYTILNYSNRLKSASKLFNVESALRFTPANNQNLIMLSDFYNSIKVYLESDVYHNENLKLPVPALIPFWQGSGSSYDFDVISEIKGKPASNNSISLDVSGILAVISDKNAIAVCNNDRRVTTNYNPRGEFYTNFYKFDCSYLNDLSENFIVFFIA